MLNKIKSWLKKLRRQLTLKRILIGLFATYAIYLLLAYFAVNPIAQKLVPKLARDNLASQASVGHVAFDPFLLKATIKDFKLATTQAQPLAAFETLVVDFDIAGMFKRAWQFKEITVVGPSANIAVNQSGELNWQALLDKLNEGESAPPSNTIPRLIIESVSVSKGKFVYADDHRETPIHTALTPLGFQLKGFSTLPQDRGDYLISAVFAKDGGRLKWKGDMGVNPMASKGVVSLEGVHIANMLDLVEGLALPVTVDSGDINTSFNYHFSLPKSIPTVKLSALVVNLTGVAGTLEDGSLVKWDNTTLKIPKLSFIKAKQPELHLQDIGLSLAELHVEQADQMQLTLKETIATLPKVDMLLTESPRLAFDQLHLQLSSLAYQHAKQFTMTTPSLEVQNIGFDLSANQLQVEQLLLSDINMLEGVPAESKQLVLASLNKIALRDNVFDLSEKLITMADLSLSGLRTSVVRDENGELNWVQTLQSDQPANSVDKAKNQDAQQTEKATSTWAINLNKIALQDAQVQVKDQTAPTPVQLDIVDVSAEVQQASLDLTKPLPVKAAFKLKQGGWFSTQGKVWPSPFKADMTMRLKQLSLKPFAPYVNQFALLKLNTGALNVAGKLNASQKKAFALHFNGGFDVKKLALIEEETDAPFLSWDTVKGQGMQFSLGPDKLHLKTLSLIQPTGKFIINADKSTNIQRILRSEATPEVVEEPPTVISAVKEVKQGATVTEFNSLIKPMNVPKPVDEDVKTEPIITAQAKESDTSAELFPVTVDRIVLQDAELEFADLSLITPFGTNIHSLNGVVNGLDSQVDKVAQVELDGKVDSYGSARIRGALQPFQATDYTDIKLAFTNLDMSKLTPYSGKFAGRRIDAGKLSVDLGYKIKDQQLVGDNKFVVNKIKLGEKVDSPDAADLPLDLAIAILEDSDGVIDLDLPISGSLDDPKFSYGSIVWKAFTNIMTKIVTAPFRALGKLFGGDGEDFDGITFEAGVSEASPPELEKIAKLSEALNKRQGLRLGIVPSYHKALDTAAIREATYREQVAQAMEIEVLEGQKAGPVDLTNEAAQKAIVKLHDKLTKKGFFKRMADKFDKPEAGYYEKAQSELIASIEVTDDTLEALAKSRGKTIYAVLTQSGVAENRIEILTPVAAKSDKAIKTEMTLDVTSGADNTAPAQVDETPVEQAPVEQAPAAEMLPAS